MENYEVKNVKTFTGREGQGFECTLYRNGKSVAKVVNTADGGEIDIYWNDTKAGRVEINTINYMEEPHTYNGTPEEKILMEYLLGILVFMGTKVRLKNLMLKVLSPWQIHFLMSLKRIMMLRLIGQ